VCQNNSENGKHMLIMNFIIFLSHELGRKLLSVCKVSVVAYLIEMVKFVTAQIHFE
jgi:hypothetical protein